TSKISRLWWKMPTRRFMLPSTRAGTEWRGGLARPLPRQSLFPVQKRLNEQIASQEGSGGRRRRYRRHALLGYPRASRRHRRSDRRRACPPGDARQYDRRGQSANVESVLSAQWDSSCWWITAMAEGVPKRTAHMTNLLSWLAFRKLIISTTDASSIVRM